MTKEHRIRLGEIAVELKGTGPLFEAALQELEFQPLDDRPQPADLVFEFGEIRLPDEEFVKLGQYHIGRGWALSHDKYLPHLITSRGDRLHVTIANDIGFIGALMVRNLSRPVDHAFNDVWAKLSKRFYYVIFNAVLQLHQLRFGQTLCHASACTNGTKTLLLMAWGGIGKTSSLIQLLHSDRGWRFLSDDLAIIDKHGTLFRMPLRMQVYPYSLAGEPDLARRLMRGRSWADKAHWAVRKRILGSKGVRRRVHPDAWFGAADSVSSAPLTHAFFLRRRNVAEFAARRISPEDVAKMIADVMQYELQILEALLQACSSAGTPDEGYGLGVDPADAARFVAQIVDGGLRAANAPVTLLDIPLGATPGALLAALKEQIDAPASSSAPASARRA